MTIAAIATAQGGAIGIIRVSGPKAIEFTNNLFSKDILEAPGYSLHYGRIYASTESTTTADEGITGAHDEITKVEVSTQTPISDDRTLVDDVIVSVFRAPHSYTGEDSVEISCHGSQYILQQVMQGLMRQGARQALPGQFTQRAFLNGKLDLSQAEAVADLIASSNAASHRVAMNQMRGAISNKLQDLRNQLLHITSLLELELDFSEEDVEFADRQQLLVLSQTTKEEIDRLSSSFTSGNAIKNGIAVTIIGAPNVGKSTLLNCLLDDDRAIVSDIQGTTRDLIEDTVTLGGHLFRFIDTAGIRSTDDTIERLGIERSIKAAQKAQIILLLAEQDTPYPTIQTTDDQFVIYVKNKIDKDPDSVPVSTRDYPACHLTISALRGLGIDALRQSLIDHARIICGNDNSDQVLITNLRHKEALDLASGDMLRAIDSIQMGISGDLIAEDLRLCLSHLSEILGSQITTDEVLGNIFKNFCIGK